MHIGIIVARSRNGVIGRGNSLPWHLPSDLTYFRKTTMNHSVVMGRRTFESLPLQGLPGREIIVLSRSTLPHRQGVRVAQNLEEVLATAPATRELFVAGGAQVYRAFYPHATRLYITEVEAHIEGDAYFLSRGEPTTPPWRCISHGERVQGPRDMYPLCFDVYER